MAKKMEAAIKQITLDRATFEKTGTKHYNMMMSDE